MTVRPIYEAGDDISAEELTASKCAEAFKADCEKLPKLHCMDFAFLRNGIVCSLAEIKCRTCRHDRYKTYMLSLSKLIHIRQYSSLANIVCLLIVRWTNRIGFIDIRTTHDFIAIGGRSDRADEHDIELVIHWSIDKFTFINNKCKRVIL